MQKNLLIVKIKLFTKTILNLTCMILFVCIPNNNFGKGLNCYDFFFNETIEYDIMNKELVKFFKQITRIQIIDKTQYTLI